MAEAAGLEPLAAPRRVYLPPGAGQPVPDLAPRAVLRRWRRLLLTEAGRQGLVLALRGDPHGVLHVRPARAR